MEEPHHLKTTLFLLYIRTKLKFLTPQVEIFLQLQTPELLPPALLESRSSQATGENTQCYKHKGGEEMENGRNDKGVTWNMTERFEDWMNKASKLEE